MTCFLALLALYHRCDCCCIIGGRVLSQSRWNRDAKTFSQFDVRNVLIVKFSCSLHDPHPRNIIGTPNIPNVERSPGQRRQEKRQRERELYDVCVVYLCVLDSKAVKSDWMHFNLLSILKSCCPATSSPVVEQKRKEMSHFCSRFVFCDWVLYFCFSQTCHRI